MEIIKKLINKPLNGQELMKILNKKSNIMFYSELKDFNNIDDILINNSCILFEESTIGPIGHWVCVIKRSNNIIEFFDSFGAKPDSYLKYLPKNFRNKKGMSKPHLTCLLYDSPYRIEYSEYKLQNINASTCGRWCVSRINNKNLSIDQFAKYYLNNKDYTHDQLVVINTIK